MKIGTATFLATGILAAMSSLPPAGELVPERREGDAGVQGSTQGRFSDRTLVLALTVDRNGGRLAAYTLKNRPFVAPPAPEARVSQGPGPAQVEVVLVGSAGARYTRRVDVPGICLEHPPDAAPHIAGDTIRIHRDTFLVEVPEIAGFDRVEAAWYPGGPQGQDRTVLLSAPLDVAHFTAAGGGARYEDLAFASESTPGPPVSLDTTGDVFWPESFGDPDVYTIYGDPAEVPLRINITIVPDGYTYAEKSTMVSHANALVAYLRAKTPYKEHDPFINYILVYAYSGESGTDQCDCGIVRNTGMSTGFPNAGFPCNDQGNRCLYYGQSCDTDSSFHLAQAELRAPGSDAKVVMVNTARYGGCGGQRAVYSAGNASATDVAAHELGHSLAGLADEYSTSTGCGSVAGGVNTSTNATDGAWPEWISTLGPPWEGAQYYSDCIYRPQANCTMRSLGSEFCSVCRQRWALTFFGHPRVASTAPIKFTNPASPLEVPPGAQRVFSITTRLATGFPLVTNSITWRMQAPGSTTPATVATGTTTLAQTFPAVGTYTLTCEVIADTNFIKPARNGANRDVATWRIDAVVDADGDGYLSNVDCNDGNPAVHPGAAEICNGVDDNCSSGVDEGFDQDHDGSTSCGGDCNDGLPSVRPGGAPICDGLNNDCNAPGWPSLAGTNEADDDGDSWSECQGDCNDALASVRPGGAPICDGMNNDCMSPGWPALAGTNEADDDGDSWSECQGDCDDALKARYPDAPEVHDGLDNQCPGNAGYALIDEVSGTMGFDDPGDSTRLCWPAQAGAGQYEVVRSTSAAFPAGCAATTASLACSSDPDVPPAGQAFYYLVRASAPRFGSWGARSSGAERTGLCGAESSCADGLDNDGDTLTDCDDPDCSSQAPCAPAVFTFVDTQTDDVGATALLDFLSSTAAGPGDYLFYAIHSPGPGDLEACAQRADFYVDGYRALAISGGSLPSGSWNKWVRALPGPWSGPQTGAYPNLFGNDCADLYGFCPEAGLGGRSPALLPGSENECEVADLDYGCGDGTWSLTVRIGRSRMSTCRF